MGRVAENPLALLHVHRLGIGRYLDPGSGSLVTVVIVSLTVGLILFFLK